MTKLPETISKRFNVITGKEVPLGCIDPDYPRASGRTTAIALHAISEAMLAVGKRIHVTDHDDYPTYCTEMSAKLLVGRIRGLVKSLGIKGVTAELSHLGERRPNGSYVWGATVVFHLHEEVHYDLRK